MSMSDLELRYCIRKVALLADVLNHLSVLNSESNVVELPACSLHVESQEEHFNGESDYP